MREETTKRSRLGMVTDLHTLAILQSGQEKPVGPVLQVENGLTPKLKTLRGGEKEGGGRKGEREGGREEERGFR